MWEKNGRAECTINASTVVIGGAVKGNIYSSERVIVLSSGMILGNIYTPRLIVEEGVILDGECVIDEDYRKDSSEVKTETEKAESVSSEKVQENRYSDASPVPAPEVDSENKPAETADSSDHLANKQSVGYFNN